MAGVESLSREDLLALIAMQQRQIDELKATVAEQAARSAQLERRLGRNFGNSSMPVCHERAAFLKAKKIDVMVIRDILGHSQFRVTADIYTHVPTPELREVVSIMEDVMSGEGAGPARTGD